MRIRVAQRHGCNCVHCNSEYVNKNGKTKIGTPRFICLDCKKSFVLSGKRSTYTEKFKEQVVKGHCYNGMGIMQCSRQYNIATSTLYEWIEHIYRKKK